MFKQFLQLTTILFSFILISGNISASNNPSYSNQVAIDTVPFYQGGTYNNAITKPDDFLPEPIGF